MSDTLAPRLGLGLGLRNRHFGYILEHWPEVDWFEAISENFMDSGGRPRYVLGRIAERYPLALHGVSLSIGNTAPLNYEYLSRLRALIREVKPVWVSDHLCWTGMPGLNSHDLLPLPLNSQTLTHVTERVRRVQDYIQQRLVLENPSTYMRFRQSTISEPEFLDRLTAMTGCGLLLDVNNVFVSCFNAGSDPRDYLEAYPFKHVVQLHLAGHQHQGTHIIDTHDRPVQPEVWQLFRVAYQRTNGASTLLEWDGNIPDFETCHAEILKARQYIEGKHVPVMAAPGAEAVGVSNPVDFLVPAVMDGTLGEST